MERLVELRESRALSLKDLADRSGVDPNTINQIELGHRKPRPSTLRKLAEGLGVEVEEILGKAQAQPESGPVKDQAALNKQIGLAGLQAWRDHLGSMQLQAEKLNEELGEASSDLEVRLWMRGVADFMWHFARTEYARRTNLAPLYTGEKHPDKNSAEEDHLRVISLRAGDLRKRRDELYEKVEEIATIARGESEEEQKLKAYAAEGLEEISRSYGIPEPSQDEPGQDA